MIKTSDLTMASPTPRETLVCPDGSRPRVLLAEDSNAARILTTALLNRMGCDVDAAENGEEAVLNACDNPYDVIIMDIEMPVMDGVTAAQEIRDLDNQNSSTPIIALSAFLADSQQAPKWRDSFDINMAKPAGREQLHQVIQTVIDVSTGAPLTSNRCLSQRQPGHLIDQAALREMHSDMSGDAMNNIMRTVIGEIQDCARILGNADARRDQGKIAAVAHKLKGIASTFAAPKLEQMAQSLEATAKAEAPDLTLEVSDTCTCADETAAALSAARRL